MPRAYKKEWLTVGQRVVGRGINYGGFKGVILSVDRRFKKPYTVKLDGIKGNEHFSVDELAITR